MRVGVGLLALPVLLGGWAVAPGAPGPGVPRAARAWADATLRAMTQAEKLDLVTGQFTRVFAGRDFVPAAAARPGSAGYVPGVPRLHVPPQWETDAGIGVASQVDATTRRERTALPSGLATAATWDPALAYRAGAMIGAEARASGFDVMLAGGVNLARDPRNGRNFEYAGEDPLLAGTMVGAEIAGIQSNHIIATTKHFAMNDQEFGRTVLSADIDEASARESDLLAFAFAIERGDPGAVMCAYNRVNLVYACQNDWLLTHVLKDDWHYPFYVMSDWGAVHSTVGAAMAGLDQESAAASFDKTVYFGAALNKAIEAGRVPEPRLDDMVRRILLALKAKGVVDDPPRIGRIDFSAHEAVAREDEAAAIVLLKNADGVLPLRETGLRVAVIGGHADVGVLSGGGSAQVYPRGGNAVPGPAATQFPGKPIYDPSSPLRAIASMLRHGKVDFASGENAAAAAALAAKSDVAVVFATQWSAESRDNSLMLPDGQNALIARVAAANPRTIVVLETGGPVAMPWLDAVAGVVEAWFPGSGGGPAIADMLFGRHDASGRLPITFPVSARQLPRPTMPGDAKKPDAPFDIRYFEGAAVGYKWFERTRQTPLFPFGFGLSYGHDTFDDFRVSEAKGTVTAQFRVRDDGHRWMNEVAQVYVSCPGFDDGVIWRLGGFSALRLEPGEARTVRVAIDPRLLANWNVVKNAWLTVGGTCRFALARSARDRVATARLQMAAGTLSEP